MCKQKTALMLNLIVWNRTVLCIKMDLALNNLQWLICHKTQSKPNQFYADTGCRLEDLQGTMNDWDGWRERESKKSILAEQLDDVDDNVWKE